MEHSTSTFEPTNRGPPTDQISQAVVEAVSEAEGIDPTELTPLYRAIDPDALEALFEPQLQGKGGRVAGEIHFSYHGYVVRVTATGEVDLEDTPDS